MLDVVLCTLLIIAKNNIDIWKLWLLLQQRMELCYLIQGGAIVT